MNDASYEESEKMMLSVEFRKYLYMILSCTISLVSVISFMILDDIHKDDVFNIKRKTTIEQKIIIDSINNNIALNNRSISLRK